MKKMLGNKDLALLVAGCIFGIVALVHFLRLFSGFNILIARQLIPLWVSLPGCFLFAALAIWMFAARGFKFKFKFKGKRAR